MWGEWLNGTQFWGLLTPCAWPVPHQGPNPRESSGRPRWTPLEEGVATRSDSRGLRVETSLGRHILTPSDLLERLNGALAMMDPWMSYFRGIVTHYRVSKC